MTKYCCGFAKTSSKVLLIRKNRPKWQAGRLNGIGGHIESGEGHVDAMVREFREETGLVTEPTDWTCFAILHNKEFQVYFFYCDLFTEEFLSSAKSMTDETVEFVSTSPLPHEVLPNLQWLIPLSEDNTLRLPLLLESK